MSAPHRTPAAPGAPRLIDGRYAVTGLLGTGGMGEVFAVRDQASDELVALKRLREGSGPREAALFEREYRTLAGLRHPRIVQVYEYGVDGESAYYTMELLSGSDLTRRAPMPWREVCGCLRETASILGVLHARRVVHRDLSPKNLWLTEDGRIKLIDFGALAPFGEVPAVVGTPPFVSPEAAVDRVLDQRADLYALGALGYWLLTRSHAFRVRTLADLPKAWQTPPVPPSRRAQDRGLDLPVIPPELDRLILSLLQLDARERPAHTASVIDALSAMADLTPEAQDIVVQGYIGSRAFVGRQQVRDAFDAALERAGHGTPEALLIEGVEGIGRTRLLQELGTTARIAGAAVLQSDGVAGDRPFGAAEHLVRQLLRAAPEEAWRSLGPYAATVARLSPALRADLVRHGLPTPKARGHLDKVRLQHALAAWFLDVSRERRLAVFVDDFHAIDAESQALVTALSNAGGGQRLLVTATAVALGRPAQPPALRALRRHARALALDPLEAEQTLELVRSLFGDVPYLERIAGRLHEQSRGNPRYCLLLAEQLVHSRAARYAEGTWHLPSDLPAEGLPTSLRAAVLAGIDRLSHDARALAVCFSAPDAGPLTRDLCLAATARSEAEVLSALSELLAHGVIEEGSRGFRLTHPALGEALGTSLTEDAAVALHQRLGARLQQTAGTNPTLALRASVQLVRAGDDEAGAALLARTAHLLTTALSSELHEWAPLLDQAVTLLTERGHSDEALVESLTGLAVSGYFVDPDYARRYGERTVAALQRALHLDQASRASRWLGPKAALWVALGRARLRRTGKGEGEAASVAHLVHCLVAVCTTLTGVAATCFEGARAHRYSQVLEPLTALGDDHIVATVHRFCQALSATAQDRAASAYELSRQVIARLEDPAPIPGMPESVRSDYLAGAYFVHGMRCVFRSDDSALRIALELDKLGPLYGINAEHLRTTYYASRGDLRESARCARRLGVKALQVGSAWRVDAIAPALIMPALWGADAVSMKRTVEQLTRLADSVASTRPHLRAAQAAYHLLRGQPAQAVLLLDGHEDEPLAVVGWCRTRGVLAAALNALGQYQRARDVCLDALSRISEEDLEFVGMNVGVQVELSLAEAALGERYSAHSRLDRLLLQHEPRQAPLLLAYLHRARARVALLVGDLYSARRHALSTAQWTGRTGLPSLRSVVAELKSDISLAEGGPPESGAPPSIEWDLDEPSHVVLGGTSALESERSRRALRAAVELTSAHRGFFVFPGATCPSVSLEEGDTPEPALLAWARSRLGSSAESPTVVEGSGEVSIDPALRDFAGVRYCVTPVRAAAGGCEEPLAGLVLGYDPAQVPPPPGRIAAIMTDYFCELGTASEADTLGTEQT